MRLSRCELRDYINYRKNDRWRSYQFYRALQRLKSPMRCISRFSEPRNFRVFQHNRRKAVVRGKMQIILSPAQQFRLDKQLLGGSGQGMSLGHPARERGTTRACAKGGAKGVQLCQSRLKLGNEMEGLLGARLHAAEQVAAELDPGNLPSPAIRA